MIARTIERILIQAVRFFTETQPRWKGCVPSGDQRIYIANHCSHLDFLLLSSAMPERLRRLSRPVAAADYWNSGPLRRYLIQDVFRGVFLRRQRCALNPLEPVAAALRQGDSLIFFPEGTRGAGGGLQPLKPGIFHLARWFPAVEIVPAWIDNSYRILPKGFAIPLPLLSSVTFGTPVRWKEGQRQEEFLAELRGALEGLRPR